MSESELCENIQHNLKVKKIDLSDEEAKELYDATLASIFQLLEGENAIDVSDFGSFWRKKTETCSVTFFKPVERLTDRINSKK